MAGEDLIVEPKGLKVSHSSNNKTNTLGAMEFKFPAQEFPGSHWKAYLGPGNWVGCLVCMDIVGIHGGLGRNSRSSEKSKGSAKELLRAKSFADDAR